MALAVTWSGCADTQLDVSSFFAKDHTVCVRFLWQYPNAYTGPMVSVDDQPRYTAVWTDSTEGEKQVYGWQYHDYRTLYDTIWKQGWRLKLLSVAVSGGTPLYTAV